MLARDYDVAASGRDYDVRKPDRLRDLIEKCSPDEVVHLASVTTLGESFGDPDETYRIIFWGTLNLLKALRASRFTGRMVFVGSSEVYGAFPVSDLPLTELQPLRPRSPYAVGKIAAEALCYQWSQTADFEIVAARPFNHIGPGQSERFAISEFARQVVLIKAGATEPVIRVGNIDTTRDFTDVRDVVSAYFLLLCRGNNGEVYNVCSGRELTVRSLIVRMCDLADVKVELRDDPGRFRSSEQQRNFGSNAKLAAATGWTLKYSIDQTLSDILADWEVRLRASGSTY